MKAVAFKKSDIQFVEVNNDKGLKVVFANLGAAIYSIRLDKYVLTRNVKDVEDFKKTEIYQGKTIGRVSNRMKGKKFFLNNVIYEVENNEGPNTLHGGLSGLSTIFFESVTNEYKDRIEIIYRHLSKHLEGGYPGNVRVEVKYVISKDENDIEVFYTATSDRDTILSLTNHTYFTLGCKSIHGLSLRINADEYLETNVEDLLPLGRNEVDEVLDFRNLKPITKDIENEKLQVSRLRGYDHFFYLNKKEDNEIVLENRLIRMNIYTDFEGVQIYTSGFDSGVPLYPECDYKYNSIAIEPSDSFEKLHLIKKDITYMRRIKYSFTYKD